MVLRALVTRPEADARALSDLLQARDIMPVLAPLLTIIPNPQAVPELERIQAILFTSANGVRALAALLPADSPAFALPVFCVGDQSARCASDLGFGTAESAGGDLAGLAALVKSRLDPLAGPLYHAAASKLAGDLAALLEEAGFILRRQTLYEAHKAACLPDPAATGLAAGDLDFALFFSPRTATAFVSLVTQEGFGEACREMTAYALSAAVADVLKELPWRRISVASRPDMESLLAVLDADLAAGRLVQ
ncbi:MAG: uroporphyrinogen-III synthase [Rhodospirillaceae bacterium]|jgi:uroporphyrinogen-III synthase|nr:uroporphyrinogen-III synthase [Rhodospirillaceae bacterium]MBT5374592.1 uroporphyrinogen-III synthase [Rhodospirillaceae bacterium]MBT5659895.1 uroporphyrinogen-III synthase [Rhodospirillaceae bacterium]MBT5752710.1 uroporphyrinogen-III synthase [Rhodospirillaceae bacterium]